MRNVGCSTITHNQYNETDRNEWTATVRFPMIKKMTAPIHIAIEINPAIPIIARIEFTSFKSFVISSIPEINDGLKIKIF